MSTGVLFSRVQLIIQLCPPLEDRDLTTVIYALGTLRAEYSDMPDICHTIMSNTVQNLQTDCCLGISRHHSISPILKFYTFCGQVKHAGLAFKTRNGLVPWYLKEHFFL